MSDDRPSVFIGSSSEGLAVAEAIQLNLDRVAEATIWSQGVFGLGGGTLEDLVERMPTFDYGILVLTADDLTTSRGKRADAPRDNVLLELGICLGALGRRRTFAVYNRGERIKLPSDLAGVTVADYQEHSSGNFAAALGAACTKIKQALIDFGRRSPDSVNGPHEDTQFQVLYDLLEEPASQFIILMRESPVRLSRRGYKFPGLRYTWGNMAGTAGGQGGFDVDAMCRRLPDAGILEQDLRGNVSLTSRGENYADWLIASGNKAKYFVTDIGGWGIAPPGGDAFFHALGGPSPPEGSMKP